MDTMGNSNDSRTVKTDDAGVSASALPRLDCMPDPFCRCCVCRGIHCLMPHPGHNHRYDSEDTTVETMRARMVERLAQRAAVERSSPILMALERLQDMLLKVEWVRQASGNKYACAFCGGVSERDGGPDHLDECEWKRETSRDFVREFAFGEGLSANDDEWLLGVWRAVGGGSGLTGPLLRFADAVHRKALSPAAREAPTDGSVSLASDGENKEPISQSETPDEEQSQKNR